MPQNFARFCGVALAQLLHSAAASGDDRSVKIRSLEAAKIMKNKWLAGHEAQFSHNKTLAFFVMALADIYTTDTIFFQLDEFQ